MSWKKTEKFTGKTAVKMDKVVTKLSGKVLSLGTSGGR